MATAPSVTSITFDKPSYNPADTITATMTYVPGTSDESETFTGEATDSTSGLVGMLTVAFVVASGVADPTTTSASDSGGRTWTQVSDSGTVAVFTATA